MKQHKSHEVITPTTAIGILLFVLFIIHPLASHLLRIRDASNSIAERTVEFLHVGESAPRLGNDSLSEELHVTPQFEAALLASKLAYKEKLDTFTNRPSFYKDLIESDLWPFHHGIDQHAINHTTEYYDVCEGSMMRFQLLNGTQLWVEHVSAGDEEDIRKLAYSILGLLDMLRVFPSKIPDVDAVLHTSGWPCVARDINKRLPILSYQSSHFHFDIPFPDPSFWQSQGWDAQAALLSTRYQNVSLASRIPKAYWEGQIEDYPPGFDTSLRSHLAACPQVLSQYDHSKAASLLKVNENVGWEHVCDYRYSIGDLDGEFGSHNLSLRHKLICGSLLIRIQAEMDELFWTFYSRALDAGQQYHLVHAEKATLCGTLTSELEKLNAEFGQVALSIQEGRRLLKQEPLSLEDIARHGAQFIKDNLTMADVLIYMRDVLSAYASLQKYQPQPMLGSQCMSGPAVLNLFSSTERRHVEMVYPWLIDYTGNCT